MQGGGVLKPISKDIFLDCTNLPVLNYLSYFVNKCCVNIGTEMLMEPIHVSI